MRVVLWDSAKDCVGEFVQGMNAVPWNHPRSCLLETDYSAYQIPIRQPHGFKSRHQIVYWTMIDSMRIHAALNRMELRGAGVTMRLVNLELGTDSQLPRQQKFPDQICGGMYALEEVSHVVLIQMDCCSVGV
jgi:hypothetical protein